MRPALKAAKDDTIKTWPAQSVEMRALSALTPYEKNARTRSPEQVAQIAKLISAYGSTNPILIDERGEMTGRACHAIELSETYVDVAVLRWQKFTGQSAINERTGKTFNEQSDARASTRAN